jgi:hypothetical protein
MNKKMLGLIAVLVVGVVFTTIANINIAGKNKNSVKLSLENIQALAGEDPSTYPYGHVLTDVQKPVGQSWNPATGQYETSYITIWCCWTSLDSNETCNSSLQDPRCQP